MLILRTWQYVKATPWLFVFFIPVTWLLPKMPLSKLKQFLLFAKNWSVNAFGNKPFSISQNVRALLVNGNSKSQSRLEFQGNDWHMTAGIFLTPFLFARCYKIFRQQNSLVFRFLARSFVYFQNFWFSWLFMEYFSSCFPTSISCLSPYGFQFPRRCRKSLDCFLYCGLSLTFSSHLFSRLNFWAGPNQWPEIEQEISFDNMSPSFLSARIL